MMSTAALYPQYCDSDILSQNLKNNHLNMQLGADRRTVGNLPSLTRQRNFSGSSTSALSTASSGSGKISPPCTFNLISFDSAFTNPREIRKLDRSMSEPCDRVTGRNANINSSRYKTELCRPFEESGYCKYSDKCQFAHGMHELRNLARHPKYKTEPCRTFHTTAYCPYGSRCHFIHNEEERNQPIPPKHHMSSQFQTQSSKYNMHYNDKVSMPGPVQRPKTIDLSLNSLSSPSESSSSSGSTSPTLFGEEFISTPASLSTAGTTTHSFNNFAIQQALASLIAPLKIQTPQLGLQDSSSYLNNHSNSAYQQELELKNFLNQRNNSATTSYSQVDSPVNCDVFSTSPSPPESVSGDSLGSSGSGFDFESSRGVPIDLTKGLRLPVFSQLSVDF